MRKARGRVLRLLRYRQRSRREVEAYLQRKGFQDKVIVAVVTEMQELGYLDDFRFAGELLQSCLRRGFGPYRARIEFLKKGLAQEIVESRIDDYFTPEEDLARARAIMEKRTAKDSGCRDARWVRRQAAYLQRRGFDRQVIKAVLRDFARVSLE